MKFCANPPPQNEATPLDSAASGGHEAVVRLLVDFKVALDTADQVGYWNLTSLWRRPTGI